MNQPTNRKPMRFPPAGGKSPRLRQLRKAAAAALLAGGVLAGCSPATTGLSFAARGPSEAPQLSGQVMSFAGGEVLLTAPKAFCFDQRSSNAGKDGGFALIAHCSRLDGHGWPGARKTAVLTASVGPALQNAAAPQTADIAAMFPSAKLLETREGRQLPLVRLESAGAVAKGASPVHWRAAFVLNRHLIALALYAPENSRALGSRGAALLNEMARRTIAASALPDPEAESTVLASGPAQSLRPRTRP